MKTNQIEKLLGKEFCKSYNIDSNKEYDIYYVKAKDLFVSSRIDLIAKYKYVEAFMNNYEGSFFKDLYVKHIEAFTNGLFIESNQRNNKDSLDKFISIFKKLIIDIKDNGVNPSISVIPVTSNNIILDGAHRVAIAAYFNQKVPVIYFKDIEIDNGASFFENRLLESNYLNYMIKEYCSLKEKIYTACFWPASNRKKDLHFKAETMLRECCDIVYKKEIKVDIHILRNFMIQVYSDFDWLGALDDHFIGASTYAEEVNDQSGFLTLYILEGADLDSVVNVKNKIRTLYGMGNKSIHISDTHDEAMSIVQMLLNDNSLHCLKNAEPDKYKNFNYCIMEFKKHLNNRSIKTDRVVLDSGAVLALYGLRNSNDIDYISDCRIDLNEEKFEQHVDDEYRYDINVSDIINDPLNHLYYYGLKFVSIPELLKMKKNRYEINHEQKDKDDIYLLNSIDNTKTLSSRIRKITIWFNRLKRNVISKLMDMVIHSVFYKPLRFIYYKIKRKPLN